MTLSFHLHCILYTMFVLFLDFLEHYVNLRLIRAPWLVVCVDQSMMHAYVVILDDQVSVD
jgi:hypothetical protein